jgi:hypothetical protein
MPISPSSCFSCWGLPIFFVDILTFLGSVSCVTKGKWKNGKMESKEKQINFLVFLPFFLSITPDGSPVMNHHNMLIYQ